MGLEKIVNTTGFCPKCGTMMPPGTSAERCRGCERKTETEEQKRRIENKINITFKEDKRVAKYGDDISKYYLEGLQSPRNVEGMMYDFKGELVEHVILSPHILFYKQPVKFSKVPEPEDKNKSGIQRTGFEVKSELILSPTYGKHGESKIYYIVIDERSYAKLKSGTAFSSGNVLSEYILVPSDVGLDTKGRKKERM